MPESEAYKKGREMRRKLLGDAYVERVNKNTYGDQMMTQFIDLAQESVFGTICTRPGLDLKTRTLVTVVSDAATGREPELAVPSAPGLCHRAPGPAGVRVWQVTSR
jgi:4-carboxymuconolactone decarboxylase